MPYIGERAYTTVMTTVERLYQKGFLERPSKRRRGFVYRAKVTREMWQQASLMQFLDWCLRAQSISPLLLSSCLIDALRAEHEPFLEELERKIMAKRRNCAGLQPRLKIRPRPSGGRSLWAKDESGCSLLCRRVVE
jgi:predicted transcriptional regulator